MAKKRSTAMLVLSALALISATMLASADKAVAQGEPMSFRLAKLEGRSCGARCPQVIVAEGVIEEDTPETFLSFLESAASTRGVLDVVAINSPGGRVVASMRLGAALRNLKAAVIVARFGDGGDLNLPTAGSCMSACVYAMMGGVKRVVPPESRLGIHRMSSLESGGIGGRAFGAPTPTYASDD